MRVRLGNRALAALMVAAYFPDIVDVAFSAAGICSPFGLYTHTIAAVILQAAGVAGAAWLATGSSRITTAFALVVLLHPAADWFTGSKLFVTGGEIRGLGLYHKPWLDLALESATIAGGWWVGYRRRLLPTWVRGGLALVVALSVQCAADMYISSLQKRPAGCIDRPRPSSLAQAGRVTHVWAGERHLFR